MTANNKEVSEVRDIPAEIWIKTLAGLMSVIIVLTGFIGIRVISQLDRIGVTLAEVVSVGRVNKSEISTLKYNVREVKGVLDVHTKEINKLKGAK